MSLDIMTHIDIDVDRITGFVEDDAFWLFAARTWYELYKPFVPMQSGELYGDVTIEPEGITHHAPYAHYQYMGAVYGPNLPIVRNKVLAGFFSPPGVTKYPTGALLHYKNPLASAKWDKAAEPSQKDVLIRRLQAYVDGRQV